MKMERVYREILYRLLEKGEKEFSQKCIAKECKLSLSTVHHALEPLRRMHAIEVRRKNFLVINPKKILLYWASVRDLKKDIVYQTHLEESVEKIETLLPQKSVLTAYSAFKLRFKRIPAEYSEVIVYGEKEEFEERFGKPNTKLFPNLIVLELDEHLLKFKLAPLAQIFVDLWNLDKWYADEFLKVLEGEINGILAGLGYR
jgi:DNA-binding transcriptional regulator YhcF (GntR family)